MGMTAGAIGRVVAYSYIRSPGKHRMAVSPFLVHLLKQTYSNLRRPSYHPTQAVRTVGFHSMWDWFARWNERQRQLQSGVDADLVRDNRKRWKLSIVMFVCSFLLIGIHSQVNFPQLWSRLIAVLTGLFFVCGVVLARWAGAQDYFLSRPDPKEPPRLWKWRR